MVHAVTVKFIFRNGGVEKFIRAIVFFLYDKIKRKTTDFKKTRIILGKYEIQTLQNDKGISTELQIYGIHEPLSTHLVLNEIKEKMVCIDLGSNIGYYAIIESNLVGKFGKIFAIEPSPKNFSLSKLNLERQKVQNFSVHNIAISDKNKEMEFVINTKSNLSQIKTENTKINSGDKIIKIPVKTLDSFIDESNIKKIDFIRMDVEGFEYNILLSSKKVLEKFNPKLFIEIHYMYLGNEKTCEILKELQNLGYEIKYFIPRIFDTPIIGELSDIKTTTINELINKLKNNQLPDAFQLILENKLKTNFAYPKKLERLEPYF